MSGTRVTAPSAPPPPAPIASGQAPSSPPHATAESPTAEPKWLVRSSELFGALCISAFLSARFFLSAQFNWNRGASLDGVFAGTAARPYSFRVLVPAVSRLFAGVADALLNSPWLSDPASAFKQFAEHAHIGSSHHAETLVTVVLAVLSFAATPIVLLRLVERLDVARGGRALAVVTAAMAIVSIAFIQGDHFFYDPEALLFGSLLSYMIVVGKPLPFTIVFLLAFANKETAILFAFAAFAYSAEPRWKLRAGYLAAQLAGAAAIRIATMTLLPARMESMRDNAMRDYLLKNLSSAVKGAPWDDYTHLAALLVAFMLVFNRIQERPRIFKYVAALALPLGVGYLKGSVWGEIRVFYDVAGVLGVMAALNVFEHIRVGAIRIGRIELPVARLLAACSHAYLISLAYALLVGDGSGGA